MLELGRKKLLQGKCLVIGGGGCSDGETSLFIRRDHLTVTLRDLQAISMKKVTLLLFHAKHASQPDDHIIIHSPAHRWQLKNKQLLDLLQERY